MLKITDLKAGDIIHVLDGNVEREGIITDISRDEKMACINNGIQDFWYPLAEIIPVPLTEDKLINTLGFEKEETEDGTKYKKGPFRVLVHDPGNYTNIDIWYREDRRHFNHTMYLHQLQNHHLEMTKVPLERTTAH